MKYVISHQYEAEAYFEISVDIKGVSYMIIYGQHINGGFCAIPNHNISCEMGDASDYSYNAAKLIDCGLSATTAKSIAEAIAVFQLALNENKT